MKRLLKHLTLFTNFLETPSEVRNITQREPISFNIEDEKIEAELRDRLTKCKCFSVI